MARFVFTQIETNLLDIDQQALQHLLAGLSAPERARFGLVSRAANDLVRQSESDTRFIVQYFRDLPHKLLVACGQIHDNPQETGRVLKETGHFIRRAQQASFSIQQLRGSFEVFSQFRDFAAFLYSLQEVHNACENLVASIYGFNKYMTLEKAFETYTTSDAIDDWLSNEPTSFQRMMKTAVREDAPVAHSETILDAIHANQKRMNEIPLLKTPLSRQEMLNLLNNLSLENQLRILEPLTLVVSMWIEAASVKRDILTVSTLKTTLKHVIKSLQTSSPISILHYRVILEIIKKHVYVGGYNPKAQHLSYRPTMSELELIAKTFLNAFELPFFTQLFDASRQYAHECLKIPECRPSKHLGPEVLIKLLGVPGDIKRDDLRTTLEYLTAEQARMNSVILTYQMQDMFALPSVSSDEFSNLNNGLIMEQE